ncbi:MAG: TIGR04076 family protein [Eggerthellaceae bacterium]|nr:TIGR04076 family protein [Eggerthellaceae bacterium]
MSMNKVKITVLKTTFDEDLAREYGVEGLKACPMLREGQEFYADYAKPESFCDEAWKAVYQFAFALAHGGAQESCFYHDDWIRTPGVAIASCNDGIRPVIFKLEATDIPAELDYTPVR